MTAVDKMNTHEAITRVVADDGYYDCERKGVDNTATVDVAVGVDMDGLDSTLDDYYNLVKRMGHCCGGCCR
jgi:hypothetical protein